MMTTSNVKPKDTPPNGQVPPGKGQGQPKDKRQGPPKGRVPRSKIPVVIAVAVVALLIITAVIIMLAFSGDGVLNDPPVAKFLAPAEHSATYSSIEFDASGSSDPDGKIATYSWDFDGDGKYDNKTSDPKIAHQFKDDGEYKVTLKVTDDSGATDETSKTITIYNRPPQISAFVSQDNAPTLTILTFHSAATDIDGSVGDCSWDYNGDGKPDWTGNGGEASDHTYKYLANGVFTAIFAAEDDDGGKSYNNITITITNQPPLISVDLPGTEFLTYQDVKATLDVSDKDGKVTKVEVDTNGDGDVDQTVTGTTATFHFTNDGTYNVKFKAYDDDGGTTEVQNKITVLNRAPMAEVGIQGLTSPFSVLTYQELGFYAIVQDMDGTAKEFKWDFNGDSAWDYEDDLSPNTTHMFTEDGGFQVTFSTTDDDGAVTTSQFNLTVDNRPPDVTIASDKNDIYTYTTVTFTATASDPDGLVSAYRWDFDGDGTVDAGPLSENTVQHQFVHSGTYETLVRVTDNDKAYTQKAIEMRVLNSPPEANLTAKNSPTTNQQLHLVANATDKDGSIVKYEWDLTGDLTYDQTTTVGELDHRFTTEGPKTLNLKVTDNEGAVAYSQVIVTIAYNDPPVAEAGADITLVIGSQGVLDASNTTDPEGDNLTYSWDLDGDGTYDLTDLLSPRVLHQFDVNGTFAAVLRVSDGEKSDTDGINITVLTLVKKWAVLIGISDYPGTINDLQYCDDDANDWDTYLTGLGYTVQKLIDSQGTWSNVQSKINWLKSVSDANDIVAFTYSGHGLYSGGDSYMALYDSDMSGASLASLVNGLVFDRAFYFFDCCESGSFADNLGTAHTYIAQACQIDELSVDDPYYTNGGFTQAYLNDGLRSHSTWSAESAFDNAYTRCVNRYGFHPVEGDGDAANDFYF